MDTTEVLRSVGSGLRDFGPWVGDAGRALRDTATADALMGTGGTSHLEGVLGGGHHDHDDHRPASEHRSGC